MDPFYRGIIGVARTLFFAEGLKFTVRGAENIPAKGGAVVVVNHTGYMDFTYAGLPARTHKRYIRYMAKAEVFKHPVAGPILRAMKHIPTDRAAGKRAYDAAVADLRGGELVGVFPEATISRSFEIKSFKSGAARMAIEAQVPIIPMAIWGSQRVWTKGYPKHLGRTNTPINIVVGEPIAPFEPVDALTAQVHSTMQQLLAQAQEGYPAPAGAYWVPARLGGSAPTLEAAEVLDAEEERARRAAHESGPGQG